MLHSVFNFFLEDIDECLHNTSGCHTRAKCFNKIGSYECICDPGYNGNGQHCVGNYS